MCGYCIEGHTLALVYQALSSPSGTSSRDRDYFDTLGYLQELPDLAVALDGVDPESFQDTILSSIVVCRGLATLMEHGFNSAPYQSLIAHPAYHVALDWFTGLAGEDDPLAPDPRFDLSGVAWLMDKATYVLPGRLDDRLRAWTRHEAGALLQQYVDFRLNGIGLCRNDLDARFRETGVLDPIEDVCADDHYALYLRLPAFWYALHWLGRSNDDVPAVWSVASMDPIGVPDFPGVDLWMQRRAALLTYDRLGITPFLSELASVRAELFQYMGMMGRISERDLACLRDALNQLDEGKHQGDFFDLGRWLAEGDLQLG